MSKGRNMEYKIASSRYWPSVIIAL